MTPVMPEFAPLIKDLAIMLSLAGIVTILFQRIHQPVVLGYLIAGIILGPHTPPYAFITDVSNVHILSELGVIFLMFYLGLEFSFKKLTRVGLSAVLIGLFEVVLMLIIGFAAGRLVNFSYYDSLFLGSALAISSTTIIIKALEELKLKTKRFADLIIGVLIVEDLLAILLIAALSTVVVTKNVVSMDMMVATFKLVLVVGGWFLAGYFIVPPLFRRISMYISHETLTIISVALCLLLVWFAASLHYSPALGAFIMGSILAETSLIHRIEKSIRPIRDIFAAVFFITVGMQIDPQQIMMQWQLALFISIVTIIAKSITTFSAAYLTGQSLNTSVRVGLSMAQIGEFSFIIVTLGLTLKVTSNTLYPLIVAVASITTFTTPYLIRFSGVLVKWLDDHLSMNTKSILAAYTAWVYRFQLVSVENNILRRVFIRILINAFLIAVIFSIVHFVVQKSIHFVPVNSWLGNGLFLFIAILLSLPFIWGMLFSHGAIRQRYPILVILIWLLTLAEITFFSIIYFKPWIALFIYLLIAIMLLIILYHQFEMSYQWLERRLISNITNVKTDILHPKYNELAPWDTHLVEIEVGDKSPFVGHALRDFHIRENFGIFIVAIAHDSMIIPAPRGEDKIAAHDKLIVLGNDEQIEKFKKQAELHTHKREIINILDHFALKPYYLAADNYLIGKTIRSSKIRETIGGLIVGLERNNERILNPALETVLQAGDLLLIVGEIDKFYLLEIKK